jgi:hypothetical protein
MLIAARRSFPANNRVRRGVLCAVTFGPPGFEPCPRSSIRLVTPYGYPLPTVGYEVMSLATTSTMRIDGDGTDHQSCRSATPRHR